MPCLTQARLKRLLSYNETTGVFTWLQPTSNRVKAGAVAGSVRAHGYVYIVIDSKQYPAHRLAFLYMLGYMPNIVDHIDCIRANNAWANLRSLSHAGNIRRQATHAGNTSGYKNVSWSKISNKWLVQISVKGQRIHGGLFINLEDAVTMAKNLQIKYDA